MKKLIVAGAALLSFAGTAIAADIPARMPAKAPAAVVGFDWTGLYIGGNVGYSWGRSATDVQYFNTGTGLPIVPPAGSITSANINLDGWIAGGQLGYNWQSSNLVLGVEGDFQWSGQKGDGNFLCATTSAVIAGPCLASTFVPAGATGASLSISQKLEWFATLRGRAGFTPTPDTLVYATGGLAYGRIVTDLLLSSFNANGLALTATGNTTTSNIGWTAGAGFEGRISENWTGKIEYLYIDLGTVNGTISNPAASVGANFTSRVTDNIVRIGLNYRFTGMH